MADYAPGWYVDPSDSTRIRYWQGSRWTKDTWGLAGYEHLVAGGPTPPVSIEPSPATRREEDDSVSSESAQDGSNDLSLLQLSIYILAVAATVAIGIWIAWTYVPASWSDFLPS